MSSPPALSAIKSHFAKAKEIRCLRLNTTIGVAQVRDFTFNEADNTWYGPAGLVCFWKNGKYAEITKKRCEKPCGKCKDCAEKRKNKK